MTEQGSTPTDEAPEAPAVDDAAPESEGVAPAGDHAAQETPERPPRTFMEERAIYGSIGRLLAEAAAQEQTARQLARADVVLQYRASKPTATITVSARSGQRVTVEYGRTPLAPEVVLGMDGDLLHRYFLGEVNPTTALTKGDIRARGPIAKVLAVLPYVSVLAPRYAALLEANGGELPEPGPEHVPQQGAAPAASKAPAAQPTATDATPQPAPDASMAEVAAPRATPTEAAWTESAPEPAETVTEPELDVAPEASTAPAPEAVTEPEPDVAREAVTEPEPDAAREAVTEPEPDVAPEAVTEPEPDAAPEAVTEPEPDAAREAVTEPEPDAAPEAVTEPEPDRLPEPQPAEAATAPEPPEEPGAEQAEAEAVAAEVADLPAAPATAPPGPVAGDERGVPAGETASVEVPEPQDGPEPETGSAGPGPDGPPA